MHHTTLKHVQHAATACLAIALLAGCAAPVRPAPEQPASVPLARAPQHVFLIVLENEPFEVTFGAHSPAPYLAHTLPKQGALLTQYYATGHYSLDNYIAMISGQAPNRATQDDCHRYAEFRRSAPGFDANGQIRGSGCIYPADVETLANQLQAAGRSWKGYMEGMGADPAREAAACGHATIGAVDHTNHATNKDQYADKHDPFVYFHSIIDDVANCKAHVVNLDELPHDLHSIATTPNFSFITPDLCHDGHNAPCKTGEPGGLVSADRFLRHWVPLITASPAFKQNGVLIITFDEGVDAKACCGETRPNGAPRPGRTGPGGGRIGAVVLSPYVAPGTLSNVPYNHYSLLRSIEDWFGLKHLGYAGQKGLRSFGTDVFTRDAAPTMQQVLAASKPSDWRPLNPDDTLYMDLPAGRVVIELDPAYAPLHAANLRILAREHYWDGLAVMRVQDDFVAQWGDPAAEAEHPAHPPRSLGQAKATLPPEFERAITPSLPFTQLPDGDVYAPEVGFSDGFPVARDSKSGKTWLVHCYGMVGAGRGNTADSGPGTELYTVIGQAPRQLDRNIALVGRVVQGMQYLAALPRGNGPMGFYRNPAHDTKILQVRLASELPASKRMHLEVLRTDTPTFAALVQSRRNRSDAWYLYKVGKIDVCNVPLPVRVDPAYTHAKP